MESQIKEFFDYLYYIGITSSETKPIIVQILSNKYNNLINKNLDDLLKGIICEYFQSINPDLLISIASNIYDQYKKNKQARISKILYKLLPIKYRQNLTIIQKYLNEWRYLINDDLSKSGCYFRNTRFLGESFHNKNNTSKIYNSLAEPNFEYSSKFLERMKFYNEKENKCKEKYLKMDEMEFQKNYPFHPNIIYSKEQNEFLKNRKTKSYLLPRKSAQTNLNVEEIKPKKKYNKEKIMKLYQDYKLKNEKEVELQKKIDKECGYTYSPKLNSKDKYFSKINDTLFERNQKMLDEKKVFVEKFNNKRNKEMKGSGSVKKIKKSNSVNNVKSKKTISTDKC